MYESKKKIFMKVAEKTERIEMEFEQKRTVLKANFNENITKLVKNIHT
jgi:hypothetical protein